MSSKKAICVTRLETTTTETVSVQQGYSRAQPRKRTKQQPPTASRTITLLRDEALRPFQRHTGRMLTIGKLGAGQERYYLDKVAQGAEDYYSGEGEAKGRWMGNAADELGLQGEIGEDQLTAMLTGRNPVDGSPLLGMRGVNRDQGPVPGFDLTFSAPKSVSVLWALGDAHTKAEIMAGLQRSAEAALGYMQEHACWTRRGAGGAEFVRGNGYLAAAFVHRSSR